MKSIFMSLLILTGVMGYSQRGPHHDGLKDMSPEQVAQLKTKKLTLALDLSDKQQQEVLEIHLENAIARQAKMEERPSRGSKPDADERYALINERLDNQIAMKEKMKVVLNKDQFSKWETLHKKKEIRGRCKIHRGK